MEWENFEFIGMKEYREMNDGHIWVKNIVLSIVLLFEYHCLMNGSFIGIKTGTNVVLIGMRISCKTFRTFGMQNSVEFNNGSQ